MRAACFSITAASLPLPSTSSAASGPGRRTHASFRCSTSGRGHRGGGVVRALDERLLEAAAPAPAETEFEDGSGIVEVEDGGEWEGKEDSDGLGPSEDQGEQDQRKNRRRQQQEDDAATAERDRFKLINGKEILQEKTYLVGVECKRDGGDNFSIEESLKELEQLADTAGLTVAGSTYQRLSTPNPRTYIGSGKVAEIRSAIQGLDIETVIFDDELSAGQLRNLEKSFGGGVRVCDRTALILDIFNQRAATHEASLQVTLAQMEYQLPRLTKMWTHLERQSGGQVKGMGEKQIEVDKRILRTQISTLRNKLKLTGNCWGAKISSDSTASPSGTNSRYASRNGAALSNSSSYASAASVPRSEGEILESANVKAFTFNELRTATRNFRPDSVLGEGGFGSVFKGWIDEKTLTPTKPGTGMVIAVKKLNQEGYQGHREWLAEVNYLGQLSHPNLVKLVGYCVEDEQRLLVYEFMPRGSLENHLFRRSSHFQPISWNLRMKIAHGAAKGLAFLHSDMAKVIYRDFKTSNILLDANYDAKLSDFGLAKDGPTGDKSHVSTRVMGTYGYAAPEYLATGHLTTKSDVFSFGVVLLEMLSGRRAVDKNRPNGEHNLVEWARPYLTSKRRIFRVLDARLGGQYSLARAQKAASLALQCLSADPRHRPTMEQVVAVLEQLHDSKEGGNGPRPQLQKKQSSNRSLTGSRSSSAKGNNKPASPRPD